MAASKDAGAEEFGRMLTARRKELGMSRRDVVDASGLSYPYVSQLETGYRTPSHKALAALAEALNLSPRELSAAMTDSLSTTAELRSQREVRALSDVGGWYENPSFAPAGVPPRSAVESSERVADQIAELVARLPREERLDALSLAQRRVMDGIIADEAADRRR